MQKAKPLRVHGVGDSVNVKAPTVPIRYLQAWIPCVRTSHLREDPRAFMKLTSSKVLAPRSWRNRLAYSLTLGLGAIISECSRGRSGRDRATSNVPEHRLARSRIRSLQEARDRYDRTAASNAGDRSGRERCGPRHLPLRN